MSVLVFRDLRVSVVIGLPSLGGANHRPPTRPRTAGDDDVLHSHGRHPALGGEGLRGLRRGRSRGAQRQGTTKVSTGTGGILRSAGRRGRGGVRTLSGRLCDRGGTTPSRVDVVR